MHRKLLLLVILPSLILVSCGAFQLKWDRMVQEHMDTLLTNPDAEVMKIIEDWNKRDDLGKGQAVDLDFIQENIIRLEFDHKKGHCRIFLQEGLDFATQQKVVGQAMVVFGQLYWSDPEQKREVIKLFGNIDDVENFVMSWSRGNDKPVFDKDRTLSFV